MASLRHGPAPDAQRYVAYADVFQRVNRDRLEKDGDSGERTSPSCTSHLSVIDRAGNMVSLTQTLVSIFGSKVLLPRSGIMMNNSIMTFDPRPGRPNSLGPGKRPLANMCPILATKDGRPHFALGASGGRRIMPAVVQIADFIARFGLSLEDAFHQPRIDSSGTDLVSVAPRLPASIRDALASRFQTAEKAQAIYPMTYACPSAVWQGADATCEGTSEPMHPWADAVAETALVAPRVD
jgi:gamma-glutamyltranspeptidase/glutathione hydrolase